MLKEKTWDNPNKMHFESAHKTFNEQTTIITTGNCIAPTQYSNYIRPYTERINPIGEPKPEGYLQNFDLQFFRDIHVPFYILDDVKRLTHYKQAILYVFFHGNEQKIRVIDGLVLTEPNHRHMKTWYVNNNRKAYDAIEKAKAYIVDNDPLPEGTTREEGACA